MKLIYLISRDFFFNWTFLIFLACCDIGLVRIEEITNAYTPKNDPDANKWHSRDIKILSEKLNTLPVFIDADGSSTVPNGPIGGQTYVSLPNDHVQYFMTWFGLTALGLFVIFFKI